MAFGNIVQCSLVIILALILANVCILTAVLLNGLGSLKNMEAIKSMVHELEVDVRISNIPNDFVLLDNGNKYLFYHDLVTNWQTAKKICESKGMHMVTIEGTQKLNLIWTVALQHKNVRWWVLASDIGYPNKIIPWTGSQELNRSGPSLMDSDQSKDTNCVYIYENKLWYYPCKYMNSVLCEKHA